MTINANQPNRQADISDIGIFPKESLADTPESLQHGLLPQVVAQTTSPMILFCGPEFHIEIINEQAARLWNVSPEAVLYKPFDILPAHLKNHYSSLLFRTSVSNEPCCARSVKVLRMQDGAQTAGYYDTQIIPLRNANGMIAGLLATSNDVTQHEHLRKDAVRNDRQQQQKIQLLANAMPLQIAFFDACCRFCFVNKMFESWSGLSGKAAEGKRMEEIFGAESYAKLKPFAEQALSGTLAEFKIALTINRERKIIEGHFLPLQDGEQGISGFYAIIIDVTERRKITPPAVKSDGRLSTMASSLEEMSKTVEEIRKKLDVAKAKIKRARSQDEKIQEIIKKWTADLQVSEAIALKVKKSLDDWMSQRAA
jgi:PAS domain S-box-containing protein